MKRGSKLIVIERIKRIRKTFGLTQTQLAARLGVSFMSISRWENGHATPLPIFLRALEALDEQVPAKQSADDNKKETPP